MSTVDLAIQIKTVYLYTVFWQVNKSYRILLAIKLLDYKKDELKDDNIIQAGFFKFFAAIVKERT